MKICWDNIEKLKLTKYGNFFDGKRVYVEKDECKNCKESFLARIDNMGDFCSLSCKKSGRFHHNYGKSFFTNKGHFHPSWKGGYETRGLPVYDIIFPKLKN